MDSSITIRQATADDVGAINELYNYEIRTGVASFDEAEWPLSRRQSWFDAHETDNQPVLVAEDGQGEVIGFASLTLLSDKSGYRFTRENTVIITPAWQGKGVGRALMAGLIAEARALGLRVLVALITSTNTASIALHESLGYSFMGTLHNAGYKFDEWHSTTYLQLDLMNTQG